MAKKEESNNKNLSPDEINKAFEIFKSSIRKKWR